MNAKPAVILLSGGARFGHHGLSIARQEGFALWALSIDYGQRHRFELEAARRVAAALGVLRHVVLPIRLTEFGGSALTDQIEVPKDRSLDQMEAEIPVTYVPARNTVFLSLALAYAETVGAADIFLGVNAVRLQRLPRLPAGLHRGLPASGQRGHQGGGRRAACSSRSTRP